ncbi:MAG: 16S rRNA (guanine(966)-N(2))-methyltransferase RsmD [Gemmatimonadaceae bacterium]|nr:16S rRNA (guanine(966)-N(2))-methyltransferase RsmD [Gemmatimonadaceae bacterium]
MRIIGGTWRGRQIAVPAAGGVRPTGDRVREAWFSIVQYDVPGARVVDLCAGSGALGIEALSRGATHVTFVDSSPASLAAIRSNLEALRADPVAYTLHQGDAVAFASGLEAHAFGLGFADPPYALPVAAALCDAWRRVPFATVFGVEHAASQDPGDGGDRRRYGQTAISFFRG